MYKTDRDVRLYVVSRATNFLFFYIQTLQVQPKRMELVDEEVIKVWVTAPQGTHPPPVDRFFHHPLFTLFGPVFAFSLIQIHCTYL